MARETVAHPGAAEEGQYMTLLTLLSKHGSNLPRAKRAQHLSVASLLLESLHFSAFFVVTPFTLRSLSEYEASCTSKPADAPELDDEEPALLAFFSLVASVCGCAPADASYELARSADPLPASAGPGLGSGGTGGETQGAADMAVVGGLFGKPAAPAPASAGSAAPPRGILPPTFVQNSDSQRTAARALASAPPGMQGAVAHLISAACSAAAAPHGVRVCAAALAALGALARALPPDLLAAFFPGVASRLLRLLRKVRTHQSALAVLALDVLFVCIGHIFPAHAAVAPPAGPSPFAGLVGALRKQPKKGETAAPAPPRPPAPPKRPRNLAAARDPPWFAAASENLSPLLLATLQSADGPHRHPNSRARAALAAFAALVALRQSNLQLARPLHWRCVFLLAELASDDFPDVRDVAVNALRSSARTARTQRTVEDALGALVQHVSRLPGAVAIACGSSEDAESREAHQGPREEFEESDRLIMEALEQMFPSEDPAQRWAGALGGLLRALGASDLAGVVSQFDENLLALALVAFQEATWAPSAIGAPRKFKLMHTPAIEACAALGAAGLLPTIHAPLLSIAECQSLENNLSEDDEVSYTSLPAIVRHAHAVICLQAVTRGAVLADAAPAVSQNELMQFIISTLGAAAAVALPEDADDTRAVRAKQAALMCIAELCDAVRTAPGAASRALDPSAALPVILPLLADGASDQPEVAAAAEHALAALASATGADNTPKLVRRHANFLVARLVRALHTRRAGHVLRHIVVNGGGTVSARVVQLAEAALARQCDDLAAASDEDARTALLALQAVLAAAPPAPAQQRSKPPSSEDAEHRAAATALFAYCTEDVEADEAFWEKEDPPGGDGNNPFEDDELSPKERDARRTPFQRLAVRASAGAADLLVGRPGFLRAAALETCVYAMRALASDRRALLPAVATLLPLIPGQLELVRAGRGPPVQRLNALAAELPAVAGACALLGVLARTARGFVRPRFVRALFPALRPLLVVLRPVPARAREDAEVPSPAALAAADAALDCVAAVAETVPDALRPFAAELVDTVVHFVLQQPPPTGEDPRRRRRRAHWERRASAADAVIRGLVVADPDRTWAKLVAAGGSNVLKHWNVDAGMHDVRVR